MLFKSSMPTSRRIKSLIFQVILMVGIYLVARAWMQKDMVSGPAPDIHAHDLQGELFQLDRFEERPVLVHFWATWCPICEFEQGAISGINEDWPVISVAMQSGDGVEVQKYMQQHGLNWRTVVDETGEIANRYGVRGVPASFVIDADNKIRFRETGLTSSWGLRLRLWFSQ